MMLLHETSPTRHRAALSGGGYRAALFHMGAMRRLFELGVLQDPEFRTVPSVSGGSLASAALAQAW